MEPHDSEIILSPGQIHRISQIAEKFKLDLMLLFGSFATGKARPESDIDIAVRCKNAKFDFMDYGRLCGDLEEVFGGKNKIDLSIINVADPFFLKKITENCRLLFGHERNLAELKIRAYKQYVDHREFLALEKEFVDNYIAARMKSSA